MRKITQNSHSLQTNSNENRFVKRVCGLERFIPKEELRETYLVMLEYIDLKTRVSYTSVRVIAERIGKTLRTVRRHLRELSTLGVIVITRRRYACRSNYTNRYTFPLLNEDFLRQRGVSPGGDTRVTVIQEQEIKKQTTTPREARKKWEQDRETFKPRVGRCHMRFIEALRVSSHASIGRYVGYTMTDEEKAELNSLREHFGIRKEVNNEGSHTEPSSGGGQGGGVVA